MACDNGDIQTSSARRSAKYLLRGLSRQRRKICSAGVVRNSPAIFVGPHFESRLFFARQLRSSLFGSKLSQHHSPVPGGLTICKGAMNFDPKKLALLVLGEFVVRSKLRNHLFCLQAF